MTIIHIYVDGSLCGYIQAEEHV